MPQRSSGLLCRRSLDSGAVLWWDDAMPIRPVLLALLAPLVVGATAPPGGSIEVAVSNVTTAQGRIHVDICSRPLFLTGDCTYSAEAPAKIGTTVVIVPDVPPGRYASQVFHDRNGNGKIDRGLFGIPKEPVGFSNDAPTHMAPPKWDAAVFTHGTEPQHIALDLRTSFL
jgi:uncharacterized protein (DUF2141 family)